MYAGRRGLFAGVPLRSVCRSACSVCRNAAAVEHLFRPVARSFGCWINPSAFAARWPAVPFHGVRFGCALFSCKSKQSPSHWRWPSFGKFGAAIVVVVVVVVVVAVVMVVVVVAAVVVITTSGGFTLEGNGVICLQGHASLYGCCSRRRPVWQALAGGDMIGG